MSTVQILGLSITVIVITIMLLKGLRSNMRVIIFLIVTGVIATIGFFNRSDYKFKSLNDANFLISPFVIVFTYAMLRYFFKRKYGFEPTYNRYSWRDDEDGRDINMFDLIVHFVPLFIGALFPYAI